jgi:hypothetical protein
LIFIIYLALLQNSFIAFKHLNSYNAEILEKFCKKFVDNIFLYESNNKDLFNIFYATLMEYEKYNKKEQFYLIDESKKIVNSFLTIYEFLDRGMKGFLSGDISYNLITSSIAILEKSLTQLRAIENEFLEFGVEPQQFYDSFFMINESFYKNNSSNNLALNLSKTYEDYGETHKRLLYYVNLNHTQFFDLFKTQITKIMIREGINMNKIDAQTIKNRINTEKQRVQEIFNDMYNELVDQGMVNSLKTPLNGVKFPEKENRHNFFRRQLMIEEDSFERANGDFTVIFSSLQKIDKAHELFFNRKMIVKWHQRLSYAIAEIQKNIVASLSFNQKKDNYMQYFVRYFIIIDCSAK